MLISYISLPMICRKSAENVRNAELADPELVQVHSPLNCLLSELRYVSILYIYMYRLMIRLVVHIGCAQANFHLSTPMKFDMMHMCPGPHTPHSMLS